MAPCDCHIVPYLQFTHIYSDWQRPPQVLRYLIIFHVLFYVSFIQRLLHFFGKSYPFCCCCCVIDTFKIFCPSWSCTIMCYIGRFTSYKIFTYLGLQEKLFSAMCTIINVWRSLWNYVVLEFLKSFTNILCGFVVIG